MSNQKKLQAGVTYKKFAIGDKVKIEFSDDIFTVVSRTFDFRDYKDGGRFESGLAYRVSPSPYDDYPSDIWWDAGWFHGVTL